MRECLSPMPCCAPPCSALAFPALQGRSGHQQPHPDAVPGYQPAVLLQQAREVGPCARQEEVWEVRCTGPHLHSACAEVVGHGRADMPGRATAASLQAYQVECSRMPEQQDAQSAQIATSTRAHHRRRSPSPCMACRPRPSSKHLPWCPHHRVHTQGPPVPAVDTHAWQGVRVLRACAWLKTAGQQLATTQTSRNGSCAATCTATKCGHSHPLP